MPWVGYNIRKKFWRKGVWVENCCEFRQEDTNKQTNVRNFRGVRLYEILKLAKYILYVVNRKTVIYWVGERVCLFFVLFFSV